MATAALAMFGVMFLVVFVARSLLQRQATGDAGIRTGSLRAAPGSVEWFAGWALVVALVAAIAAPVAELAGLDPLTTNRWLRGTGFAVAAVGIAATFAAQVDMGTEWRIGIDHNEATALVTDGLFGVVRNPIFTAIVLTGAGLTAMVPNPIAVAGLALLVVAVQLQVRRVEEPYLTALHGTRYRDYTASVGRFLPRLRRSR